MSSLSLHAVRLPARVVLVVLLAAGLFLAGPVGDAHAASRASKVKKATSVAAKQLGDPYRYGAAGPDAFDCSGLLYYSFRKAGLKIPRTSSAQAGAAKRIAKSELRRGDVMFFHDGGRVYHAAIFLGRRDGKVRMLHAPGTGKDVRRDVPWTKSWYAGTFR